MSEVLTATTTSGDSKTARDLLRLPVDFAPGRTALEHQLCAAFSTVLRVEPVGRDDEFYDLGGDSLAGEALSLEIEKVTGQQFPISNLFRYATPAAIAKLVGGGDAEQATDAMRFFIVHGRGGYTSLRPEFRAGLAPGRAVTMFELPGIRGDRRPLWDIRKLAETYVRQLEAEQPEGPVRLAAFCAGSFIALEMAALLRRRGRTIDRLVLLDPGVSDKLRARHAAELEVERAPGSLSGLAYWRRTGRWRGNKALDAVAVWFGQRREAAKQLDFIRKDGFDFRKNYINRGFQDWPRAVLLSMYRYTWPEPFTGETHILASVPRAKGFTARDSIWRRFAPNLTVKVMAERHARIGKGTVGTDVAAELERILSAPSAGS